MPPPRWHGAPRYARLHLGFAFAFASARDNLRDAGAPPGRASLPRTWLASSANRFHSPVRLGHDGDVRRQTR